ncbi:MAG: P-loop NTPase [Eubacteriales bacterium]|nr:P-loop NTPase [Eubacteriales bacterium]
MSIFGESKKITVIAGHYGCGKTNIAVNLALKLAAEGRAVSIVDLDIVNPHFRTADSEKLLQDSGVDTILPEFANTNVETPTLPVRFRSIFSKTSAEKTAIIDVGGDDAGAIVLGSYADDIIEAGYDMFFVYNKYRPSISNVTDAYEMMLAIERASRLKFSGIINNSNLGSETDADVVLSSIPNAKELSKLSGKPVTATTAFKKLDIGNTGTERFIYIDDVTKKLF